MELIDLNQELPTIMNRLRMNMLSLGYAELDRSWYGTVNNPSCTRLYYILSGSFTVSGQEFHAGNCLLLPAGYSFSYSCRDTMDQIFAHLQLCDENSMDLLAVCGRPLSCPFSPADAQTFFSLAKGKDPIESLQAQALILSTVMRLLSEHGISLHLQEYSPQIRRAMEYIADHLSIQLTIPQVAQKSFLAPSTLTRNFRRETGMTIRQYVDELVLSRAEHLLKNTTLPVRDISDSLGFCDQFYFSRQFKKWYGVSPREYRKTCRI